MKLKSNRKYVLNAFRDWINDQDLTPYLVIDAEASGVIVPEGYSSSDGRLCLDVSTSMVREFSVTSSALSFKAQFRGQVHTLKIPLIALEYITCKEFNSWVAWFGAFDDNELVEPPMLPSNFKIEDD